MKNKVSVLAMLASIVLSVNVSQAAVDCSGEITSLSLQLNTEGTVTMSLAGGPSYTYLCDLDGAGRNGVSAVVCRSFYATLLAAKASGKKVTIRFYNYNSCAAIPAWTNAGALGWTVVMTD